jgi:hypothetical protein
VRVGGVDSTPPTFLVFRWKGQPGKFINLLDASTGRPGSSGLWSPCPPHVYQRRVNRERSGLPSTPPPLARPCPADQPMRVIDLSAERAAQSAVGAEVQELAPENDGHDRFTQLLRWLHANLAPKV